MAGVALSGSKRHVGHAQSIAYDAEVPPIRREGRRQHQACLHLG
jgi:hypothetical protein